MKKHLWLTGLSGSGKTTLAENLIKLIPDTICIDGDVIRKTISKDLGFSKADRHENCLRAARYVDSIKDKKAIICLCSPYIETRRSVKQIIDIHEIYIKCSLNTCIKRDPKGLYKKYLDGTIKEMIGFDIPYEEYDETDLIVDTDVSSIEESVSTILNFINPASV